MLSVLALRARPKFMKLRRGSMNMARASARRSCLHRLADCPLNTSDLLDYFVRALTKVRVRVVDSLVLQIARASMRTSRHVVVACLQQTPSALALSLYSHSAPNVSLAFWVSRRIGRRKGFSAEQC